VPREVGQTSKSDYDRSGQYRHRTMDRPSSWQFTRLCLTTRRLSGGRRRRPSA